MEEQKIQIDTTSQATLGVNNKQLFQFIEELREKKNQKIETKDLKLFLNQVALDKPQAFPKQLQKEYIQKKIPKDLYYKIIPFLLDNNVDFQQFVVKKKQLYEQRNNPKLIKPNKEIDDVQSERESEQSAMYGEEDNYDFGDKLKNRGTMSEGGARNYKRPILPQIKKNQKDDNVSQRDKSISGILREKNIPFADIQAMRYLYKKTKDVNARNKLIDIANKYTADQITKFTEKFKKQAMQEVYDAMEQVQRLKASRANILSSQLRYKEQKSNRIIEPMTTLKWRQSRDQVERGE